jgi:hypothetical protein
MQIYAGSQVKLHMALIWTQNGSSVSSCVKLFPVCQLNRRPGLRNRSEREGEGDSLNDNNYVCYIDCNMDFCGLKQKTITGQARMLLQSNQP